MTDIDLLLPVKNSLQISGDYSNDELLIKIKAIKGYMINAGVKESVVYSPLGIQAVAIGINDISVLDGEIRLSKVFEMFVTQLSSVPEVIA